MSAVFFMWGILKIDILYIDFLKCYMFITVFAKLPVCPKQDV